WVRDDGDVCVVALRTGRELFRSRIKKEHLAGLSEATIHADATQVYLRLQCSGFSGKRLSGDPVAFFSGLPSTPIDGILYAFDRKGRVRWFNRLPLQALLLEALEDTPLLLLAVSYPRDAGGGQQTQVTAILSIDKRTGKWVYNREWVNHEKPFHA